MTNIRHIFQRIENFGTDKDLSDLKLYIRIDSMEVLCLSETVSLSANVSCFKQLLIDGLLVVIPVGKQLEHVRRKVIELDRDLHRSLRSKNVVPLNELLARHGLL